MTATGRTVRLLGVLLAVLWSVLAWAEGELATGNDLRVSLVTMGPGANYWERFGHNAILIENTSTRAAALYNYGVFDFRADSFLLNFLRGKMQYQLMPFDPTRDFARYVEANRDVRIQYLRLTPQQRFEIARFLDWNARPENAPYQYDYFLDNCSTRIRNVLDDVLDGALRTATEDAPAIATYRFHAERLSAPEPFMYAGLRLVLGRLVDQPISRWQELFMPDQLHDAISKLMISDQNGESQPLVERVWHLHESKVHDAPVGPPHRPWLALAGGLALAAGLIWSAAGASNSLRHRLYLWFRRSWLVLSGLAGLFLAWLAFGSDHSAAHYNENLLLLSPLALVPLFLQPTRALWPIFLLALMALGALALKWLPDSQSNLSVVLLVLPIQLALLWNARFTRDPSFGT